MLAVRPFRGGDYKVDCQAVGLQRVLHRAEDIHLECRQGACSSVQETGGSGQGSLWL